MSKNRNLSKVEDQIKTILGTGKFLVILHKGGVTSILSGDTARYEEYGFMRAAETLLDITTIREIGRPSKDSPALPPEAPNCSEVSDVAASRKPEKTERGGQQ